MKKKKAKKIPFALVAASVVFFLAVSFLGRPSEGGLLNSPDEAANAFWSERVAHLEPLALGDAAVGIAEGALHPRSFAVRGEYLIPGSFPGLFLSYGFLKFLTDIPLFLITPLLTALAGLLLCSTLSKVFDRRVAFWSAILFYLHPAVIYYAGRGLFHNLFFIDLTILAAWFLVAQPFAAARGARWKTLDVALGGLTVGWAVITRASEAPWLLIAIAALWGFSRRDVFRKKARSMAIAAAAFLLPVALFLALNAALYGGPLKTAYVAPAPVQTEQGEVGTRSLGGPGPSGENGITEVETPALAARILPFGFHPRLVVLHGTEYVIKFFNWYTVPAALGFLLLLIGWRKAPAPEKRYALATIAVSAWLGLYYGSWYVRDHYDPTLTTIGTSYVRYFLPIYVLTLPWAASGMLWLAAKARRSDASILAACLMVIASLGIRAAVFEEEEGLLAVRRVLRVNEVKKQLLLERLPGGAVLMTRRFDKVVFPDILRVIPLEDEASFQAVARLSGRFPIYHYGPAPSREEADELERKAAAAGLRFEQLDSPIRGETLHRLIRIEPQ
jgi:hypothetical protein